MLQIYVYGQRESGFLDLEPDTVLHLEADSDLFDEDLNLGVFSLPIDIPWTGTNRRLLDFAERFKNNDPRSNYFNVTVYDDGFPELTGKLSIIGRDGDFSGTRGKFSATLSGMKGLFGSAIKNKKMTGLHLGGTVSWEGKDSRHFAEDVMKGNYPQYSFLKFVPVAIENYFDTGRKDYDEEFLAKDTVNTVVITGSGADGWTFGRPLENGSVATEGTAEYADYRTVPFLKTKFILQKIFEEHGFRVTGDFFTDPVYDDLVTFNNCGIEYYSPGHLDYTRSINPANHVPDILIIDYLKSVFKFFSIYPVFMGENEVRLYFRKDLLKEKRVYSLNGIVEEMYSSNREDEGEGTGYKISYDWGNDDYVGDRVKELTGKSLVGTVNKYSDLINLTPGRQLTIDDIAFVTEENMYYQVADATTTPVKWEAWSEKLGPYVFGDGERSVELGMSTLCSYVEEDPDSGLMTRRNYLGCRMNGSYINNKGIAVKAEFSNKIFLAKKLPNSSGVYVPLSYNRSGLSLILEGGLADVYHRAWQKMQNSETVKVSLQVNRRTLADIQASTFFEIAGVHFLMKKKEPVIPQRELMTAEMMVV